MRSKFAVFGFRGCLITFGLFVLSLAAKAQVGNEWIKYNQFYYKIATAKDGIYKLTYNTLNEAGFPVDAIDPRRLQLFHRGVEQAIYVEGQTDADFGSNDFIEFYGKKNDGTLDAELYKPSSAQPHTFHNLHNDTTSYFLTFNPLPIFGKRMEVFSEVNASNLSKESAHTGDQLTVYTGNYFPGVSYSDYVQTSFFDEAEGWTGNEIRQNGAPLDHTLTDIVETATTQGLPQLEVLLIGRNLAPHAASIAVGRDAGNLRILTTAEFFGFTKSTISLPINWSDIGSDGKMVIRVGANGVDGQPDRISVSYIRLKYPQTFNALLSSEKKFTLKENGFGKSYIEIQNPAAGLRLFDVTDPVNVIKIGTTATTTLNAIIPYTTVSRKIFSTNTVITPAPATIKKITFRQIIPAQHDYIIISNKQLMKPALGYSDVVRAYGGYRASTAGGGYDTLVVDVNQLYDQFNYGEVSSLAVFHFMKFLTAAGSPKYLFIIGKGLTVDYNYFRAPAFYPTYKNFVPAAGYPPSDMFYTAGLAGTTNEPAVPTGRITAAKPADVAAYLNKVVQMEALPFDGLWRKNILHLSGGINTGEPERFRAYMSDFQSIAEGFYLGGSVKAVAKRSTDIQLVNISEEVNKGLNLVTFYGHSSPGAIDFEIGFATDPILGYNNPGKYPTLLMNGCNAGAFFFNTLLFGEDWVNAAGKGAVGFIAHSSYGFESLLKKYSDTFYEVGYGDSTFIHKGLGDIQKEVAVRFTGANPSVYDVSQAQQMLLLGDPAVKLFGAKKADYEINENNVFIESFDGSPITVNTDSFALNIIVRNFGQAKKDSLLVRMTRTFEDNSAITIHQLFPAVKYMDTLVFVIKKEGQKGFGNNTFLVKVDSDDILPELSETNNTASKGFLIPLNGTKNIFPTNYAIVNGTQVNLTFQTTDLLSGERQFLVEVDTTHLFSSPYKKQFTVTGTVLAKQALAILSTDSLAYYWRTKLAQPKPGENTEWTLSSFTHILNGAPGWAQVHFPQYLTDESVGLIRDVVQRKLRFEETETDISIKTFGSANGASNTDVSVKINNAEYNLFSQAGGCRTNTINLLAFDKTSTVPYAPIPFNHIDPRTCGRDPQVINNFLVSELKTGNGDDMIQTIDNVIIGDSVVLFSMGNAGYASWHIDVKNKLGELGISVAQINALLPGEPVVILGKKGTAPGTAKIFRTSSVPVNQQVLQIDETITGRYTSGSLKSVLIGPAQQWKNFSKRTRENEPTDQVAFDIIGIDLNGVEQLLFADITTDKDLSTVAASQYPFLKVVYKVSDDVNLTAVQLRNWLVLYEPVAEGLLIYKSPIEQSLVQEGQDWTSEYGFINIGDRPFSDSLSVRYEFFNKSTRVPYVNYLKIKAPLPTDTTLFSIATNTTGIGGLNDVNVFVNPRVLPEQYYENNTLELPDHLNVQADLFRPVLDVTIDGRYVENGDYVSSNPAMRIKLWDENGVVLKKDTAGVTISLKYPCEDDDCNFQRINLSRSDVVWTAATATNYFTIDFNPVGLPEGVYTLRVEVGDANGNSSGEDPYQISFVVTYDASIEFSDPHPNPSNSSFYFGFVVSGEEAPDQAVLQIVSVAGKVLNEIQFMAPFFHVGINNLTWNGKDAAGNEQPAGIYIYHLVLKTGSKQNRKNGKVVIVR
jgi:hypothetical protein